MESCLSTQKKCKKIQKGAKNKRRDFKYYKEQHTKIQKALKVLKCDTIEE